MSADQTFDGVLCFDKPAGMTSFAAVAAVRRALGRVGVKAGHAGTLDPMATGVLPVCLGEGTKLVQFLVEHDKVYRATVTFGTTTDTLDKMGRVTKSAPFEHVTREALEAAARTFVGRIAQKVPAYSAVRVGGERLYEKARRGEEVLAPTREVQIDSVRVLSFSGADVELEVACGRGTYIRQLASDLAEALGTVGHLSALRRLRVGRFSIEGAATLEMLREWPAESPDESRGAFHSLREALGDEIAELRLDEAQAARLAKSGSVPNDAWQTNGPADPCAVVGPDGELCAVVRITLDSCKTLRVFRTPTCIPSRADVTRNVGAFDPGVQIP